MPNSSFSDLALAALTGGAAVKLYDIGIDYFKAWLAKKTVTKEFVDHHLEPLLKSADELVGKLRSLSETDFKTIARADPENLENHEFASLLYLFGRFWAQIELMRQQGMTGAAADEKRGKHLQTFFDCLESRRVRIIPRILQRAVGESLTEDGRILNFIEFHKLYSDVKASQKWIAPLAKFLSRTEHTTERQQLLQYGAVIHAMIDTLDPLHRVTRDRPSWRDLKYRVFKTYLKMVTNVPKYIGPPKRSGPNEKGGSKAKRL